MERLTKRLPDDLGTVPVEGYGWPEIAAKLAQYEDAEEQGRLIILPNKIGDHVFLAYRGRVEELEIGNVTDNVFYTRNVETEDRSVDIYPRDFGRYVFQTKEEAAQALQEAKNGTDAM